MVTRNVKDPGENPTDTLYFGGLHPNVNEKILRELCIQAGPVVHVTLPKDTESGQHKGYGFVVMTSVESAKYARELFDGTIKLFNRPVRVKFSPQGKSETPADAG